MRTIRIAAIRWCSATCPMRCPAVWAGTVSAGGGRTWRCPGAIDVVGACVWFDLQVRVTPYRRIGGQLAPPLRPQGRPPARAASAPAPMALRWAPGAARWVRLWVPVRRAGGALVVDPAVAAPETRELPPA